MCTGKTKQKCRHKRDSDFVNISGEKKWKRSTVCTCKYHHQFHQSSKMITKWMIERIERGTKYMNWNAKSSMHWQYETDSNVVTLTDFPEGGYTYRIRLTGGIHTHVHPASNVHTGNIEKLMDHFSWHNIWHGVLCTCWTNQICRMSHQKRNIAQ